MQDECLVWGMFDRLTVLPELNHKVWPFSLSSPPLKSEICPMNTQMIASRGVCSSGQDLLNELIELFSIGESKALSCVFENDIAGRQ